MTNPLKEVVCQLRFPAILSISSNSPSDFQERIRTRYPLYEKVASSAMLPPDAPQEIADLFQSLPILIPQSAPEHHFGARDKSSSITLTQEFLAVSEMAYTSWEVFRKDVFDAVGALIDTYAPAFYERIGLRYIDILDREACGLEESPWSKLLNPAFAGMLGSNEVADEILETGEKTLMQLSDIDDGRLLLRHGLVLTESDVPVKYVIDADFHTSVQRDCDAALEVLDRFNALAGNLFRWATSDELRTALGKENL